MYRKEARDIGKEDIGQREKLGKNMDSTDPIVSSRTKMVLHYCPC